MRTQRNKPDTGVPGSAPKASHEALSALLEHASALPDSLASPSAGAATSPQGTGPQAESVLAPPAGPGPNARFAPRLGDFLDLPARASKPRTTGITHVFDKGTPRADVEARLASAGAYVDVWKHGFGTSYLDPQTAAKNAVLRRYGVKSCPGGTLMEAAWLQGRVDAFLQWATAAGFDCVEVSSGSTCLPADVKARLIRRSLSHGFEVFAEVGSKDPEAAVSPEDWMGEARSDAEAGANWIVAEGRESGNVGLYNPDGSVRQDVFEALETVSAATGVAVVYEAPRRSQQAWLISNVGPDANLGNVAPSEVLGLEALRTGLRADTITSLNPAPHPEAPPRRRQ